MSALKNYPPFKALFWMLILWMSISSFHSWAIPPEPSLWGWRQKPELFEKVVEKRQILVSSDVISQESDSKLSLISVGIVNAPLRFVYAQAKDFQKLTQVSDHFKEAKWDEKDKILRLKTEALGYRANMTMKIEKVEKSDEKQMKFEVIKGSFKGMKGIIKFSDFQGKQSEIALNASYISDELPLPKALMGLGLEVIAQRVSGLMRGYLEEQYKK